MPSSCAPRLEARTTLSHRLLVLVVAMAGLVGGGASAAAEPAYHPGTTRKLLQLTGDTDRTLRVPTLSRTATQAGVVGTDLGSSFEHKGKLCFLFGDTRGRPGGVTDCLAFSESTDPKKLTITFPLAPDGRFRPIEVSGISQGPMEVPCGGISVNGAMYIVHTTQWHHPDGRHDPRGNMERSALARSTDDGATWKRVYTLSCASRHDMTNARFVNVGMAVVEAEKYPGQLPYPSGTVVLIWGSGAYRKSNPCLACIPADQIETKSALRYFAGFDSDGRPKWARAEARAAYLFDHPQLGEFSTAWVAPIQRWVILYNATEPRGIVMRTAAKPWGPYSEGQLIFDPWKDGGYGRFMHAAWDQHRLDAFCERGRENQWGAEYGPYIIPRFTAGNARRCHIYYTLSTWRPYQTVLMRSEIGEPQASAPGQQETTALLPPDAEWHKSSANFYRALDPHGSAQICTYANRGDADTGWMWRWLPRDRKNVRLQFDVYGGHAEVMLLEGGQDIPTKGDVAAMYRQIKAGTYGDVVQCTWGHDHNDIHVPVDWSLAPYDSANLKVVIIDHLSEPWGFASVSQMTLTRFE